MAAEDDIAAIREKYGLSDRTLIDRLKEHKSDYAFIILPMIAFTLFFYYPLTRGIWLTFTEVQLGAENIWVGLDNYVWLITNDLFQYSLVWTLIFVASTTFLQLTLGLAIAVLLHELAEGWRQWATATVMAPYFGASLVGGIIWLWVLQPEYGVVGKLFIMLGMDPIQFLSGSFWPNVSLIIAQTWHDYGYAGLIYVAALQSIPTEQYEAAAMDGANRLQRFRDITIPHLIIPTIIILAIRTAWNMAEFSQPFVLTGGGPGTQTTLLSILVFETGFVNFQFGRAYTIGMIMLAISVLSAVIYIVLLDEEASMYV